VNKHLTESQTLVDRALNDALSRIGEPFPSDGPEGAHECPPRLREAMRYAALSPGKRLRPALVFGAARALGEKPKDVLPPACAVEMIHAYSLVHDDLPSMDDDDVRRGRPTLHRAFDEPTALLAGDALLTEAFVLLAEGPGQAKPRDRLRAVRELSRATGAAGMVGGQQDDIELTEPDLERLRSIHRRKTGRLIQASAALGAIWVGASERDVDALRRFGADLGLAFQLVDDVLDNDGVARLRGKDPTRKEAVELTERAIAELERFGKAAHPLTEIARMITARES
jgi:geranylgeranyl diphosphate synthase, type II